MSGASVSASVESKDEAISPFALLRRRGSATLVVAFSGINQKVGRFAYYKSFAEFDTLLLNCADNGWYCRGVQLTSAAPRLAETVAYIAELGKNYDRLVFFGGSMGGYGAILVASFFPGAVAVAMGPEIYAGLRQGFFNGNNRDGTIPFNLSALFARGAADPTIIVGEKKNSDMFGLIETKSERVFGLINCHHQIMPILNRIFGTIEGLVKAVLDGSYSDRLAALRGSYGAHPTTIAVSYFCDIGALPIEQARAHLETLPDGYFRSYLCTAIARRLQQVNDWRGAIDYCERGIACNPADLDNHVLLASSHFQLFGRYPATEWRQHKNPLFVGVPLYDQSVATLNEWMPIVPKAPRAGLGSVARLNRPELRDRHAAVLADPERQKADIVLLGDSIFARMAGANDDRIRALWRHYTDGRAVYNLGVGGDHIAHIHWRIGHGEIADMAPRLLLLRAGVNDLLFDAQIGADEVAARTLALSQILLDALPATRIVVLSLLPSTYAAIERGRVQANAQVAGAIEAWGHGRLRWADGEHVLRNDAGALMREWFTEYRAQSTGDEQLLHPNALGYRRLFLHQENLIVGALGLPRRAGLRGAHGTPGTESGTDRG